MSMIVVLSNFNLALWYDIQPVIVLWYDIQPVIVLWYDIQPGIVP